MPDPTPKEQDAARAVAVKFVGSCGCMNLKVSPLLCRRCTERNAMTNAIAAAFVRRRERLIKRAVAAVAKHFPAHAEKIAAVIRRLDV